MGTPRLPQAPPHFRRLRQPWYSLSESLTRSFTFFEVAQTRCVSPKKSALWWHFCPETWKDTTTTHVHIPLFSIILFICFFLELASPAPCCFGSLLNRVEVGTCQHSSSTMDENYCSLSNSWRSPLEAWHGIKIYDNCLLLCAGIWWMGWRCKKESRSG